MDEEYPNSQTHLIISAQALSYPLKALLLQYLKLSQEPVLIQPEPPAFLDEYKILVFVRRVFSNKGHTLLK